MFKVGDKVVCINIEHANSRLKLYNTYTIKRLSESTDDNVILKEINRGFLYHRFILLSDFRKQKLKKICSRLEIE